MSTLSKIAQENMSIVEAHFHSESQNDVDRALTLFTDDIVWEAPARGLRFEGKEAVGANYRAMFASVKDIAFQNLDRFATHNRVADDSIVTFRLTGDGFVNFPIPIGSLVEMRLVHIFEMRDGKISREIAFEMARIVQ